MSLARCLRKGAEPLSREPQVGGVQVPHQLVQRERAAIARSKPGEHLPHHPDGRGLLERVAPTAAQPDADQVEILQDAQRLAHERARGVKLFTQARLVAEVGVCARVCALDHLDRDRAGLRGGAGFGDAGVVAGRGKRERGEQALDRSCVVQADRSLECRRRRFHRRRPGREPVEHRDVDEVSMAPARPREPMANGFMRLGRGQRPLFARQFPGEQLIEPANGLVELLGGKAGGAQICRERGRGPLDGRLDQHQAAAAPAAHAHRAAAFDDPDRLAQGFAAYPQLLAEQCLRSERFACRPASQHRKAFDFPSGARRRAMPVRHFAAGERIELPHRVQLGNGRK